VPLVPGRHRVLRISALGVCAALFVLASLTTPSLAATRSSDADTFTLVAQSNDVIGSGKFSLAVSVRANMPARDLRVEVTLFPKLENRSEFNSTIQNVEPAGSSCLSETAPQALARNSGNADGITRLKLTIEAEDNNYGPCSESGTTLMLGCTLGSCGGVYPVEVALIDRKTNATVQLFTTHLVELDNASVSSPLNVGFVISLGSKLALSPTGASTLTKSQISSLSDTLATIAAYPALHVTLLVYPQLVAALKAAHPTPTRLISRLHRLVATRSAAHSIELLGAPFTPINTSALAAASGEVFDQLLDLGKATTSAEFGDDSSGDTYLAPAPLSSEGAQLVAAQCVDQLILPSGSAPPPTDGLSQTAPLSLTQSSKTCEESTSASSSAPIEAFVTDPASSLLTSQSDAPVLVAHQLLAELAQIYFEQPNAAPRSVVLSAGGSINPELLNVVLNGLNSDAYLHPTTIGSLFSITPVAAAGSTATLTLPNQAPGSDQIGKTELSEGSHELAVAASVVPTDSTLLATLSEDLVLAHSYGLSNNAVAGFLDAPSKQLRSVARALSFIGTLHFTLTAATGRLPITIQQHANMGPIFVRIRLESSNLVVLPGSSSSNVTELKADATTLANAQVQVEGSGTSTLNVDVLSPTGNQVLLSGQFKIHSTAISGVAIAISVLSLVVLAAWWIRSARKKHRAKAQAILQP
jgi:hypothetical protein